MASENLQSLYDDLIKSKKEENEFNQITNQKFENESERLTITKPVPKDPPKLLTQFRTSNVHQLDSDDHITYNLNFENINDKLRILVDEKNSNPKNTYESKFSLEELIKLNDWFKIFNDINDLLSEFELLLKNDNLRIKLKKEGELSLFIILPNKLMEPIELVLHQNQLKERKLFKELYLALLNIEQKHRQEARKISERLINLENAVGLSINHSQHNKFSVKEKENLEQLKNALKQEIQMMENNKVKFGLNTENIDTK
jgi:hypothetical protein